MLPIIFLKNALILIISLLVCKTIQKKHLKMVQIIFRHGARYSLHSEIAKNYPNYEFLYEKEGQLTEVGMR
jgi:hypothetical protein